MAPRTRNSEKKRRPSHRREVHFPRREIPIRKSGTSLRPPPNYENLILYYLTKLKRLFSNTEHPHPRARENSADKMRREQLLDETKSKTSQLEINPNKYAASHTSPKPRPDAEDDGDSVDSEIKEKVYNVVNAAIEYGFANNVLERKGDCFVFRGTKRNSKIANRQPTPGPSVVKRSYCAHCSCSNCKTFNASSDNNSNMRSGHHIRPMSENNASRSNWHKNVNALHESKTQHVLPLAGRSSRQVHDKRSSRSKSCTVTANKSRMRRMCTCSKCRALEQRRKMQRK